MKIRAFFRIGFLFLFVSLFCPSSEIIPLSRVDRVRMYTRSIEFDYVTWTANAIGVKLSQSALAVPTYMKANNTVQVVQANLSLTREIDRVTERVERAYADPEILNPEQATADDNAYLARLRDYESRLKPVSEAIVQQQVSTLLAESGLTLGGQPVPPVMYHTTPLPVALIVSPRSVIQQDANISLEADLTTPEIVDLEKAVEADLEDASALVVPVGGIGVYPTMVMSTTDLPWLVEVVAHEWTHNYLTLRPLGLNYDSSPQLRTMNETAASIAGKEIGSEVIRRYYPEFLPEPAPEPQPPSQPETVSPEPVPQEPPPFDYREEMHETRVTVDQMLAEGKIDEAEAYMEARRRMFWDNGYQIRRLNQAYFAFYGAYADIPGGAAGQDPVGPAVRALRAKSSSLTDFLNRISWMTSFEELQQAVQE